MSLLAYASCPVETGGSSLAGTDLADFIISFSGNDQISLSKGNDLVDSGFGDDVITVGSGNAVIAAGGGKDTVSLSGGDWLVTLPGGTGNVGQVVNNVTGQSVTIGDVETLKLGATTVNFAYATDKAVNSFVGTNAADFIKGRDGADTIATGDGNDWVSGGNGKDNISTGAGDDIIDERSATVGTSSNATSSANSIDAGIGNDTVAIRTLYNSLSGTVSETFDIKGGTGTDLVYLDTGFGGFGAFGNQFTVAGNQINVQGFGSPNASKLATLNGVEQVVDSSGDQVWTLKNGVWTEARQVRSLTGTLLSEDVKGGGASDTLKGGGGFDRFTGGAGIDTVELGGRSDFYMVGDKLDPTTFRVGYRYTQDGFTGVSFTSSLTPKLPGFSVAADVEKLKFADGIFNYKFVSALNPQGLGTATNDIIVVDTGAQPMAETASITLGAGKDYVAGIGNVFRIDGGIGDDRVTWRGAANNAKFTGGDGNDSINVAQLDKAATNVVIDGGNGDDALGYSAVEGSAKLFGGAGDDQIFSSLNGTVDGGSGNDVITLMIDDFSEGPAVRGSATGGFGDDLLVVLGNSTDYTVKATTGGFIVTNLSDGASALVQSIEAVRFDNTAIDLTKPFTTYQGTGIANSRTGGTGVDLMHGMGGNDVLNGGGGDDSIGGGLGNDTLLGGTGNDFIDGDEGNDAMTGGTGEDHFYFATYDFSVANGVGADRITDFDSGAGIGDVLVFESGIKELDSFQDMMSRATNTAQGTLFDWGNGNTLLVENVTKASFVADDFLFL